MPPDGSNESSTAAARRIARVLGEEEARWFRAPGRVNLIGDHTDYNEGFVLPVAIDRDCIVAVRPAGLVTATSLDRAGRVEVDPAANGSLERVAPGWPRLVAAVVAELADRGRPPTGAELTLASDVPLESGLSSSAAFEVACAVALAAVAGWDPGDVELALACRSAEERATGVPCGIMDQLVSVAARASCANLIDCRTLELTPVPLPERAGILVVHSGVPRSLAGSAYEDRRRACEELALRLGIRALRDATLEQVADEPLGRHVVSENARVLDAVAALEHGDLERLGALLTASHASLRDDFGVSTPGLDVLVSELHAAGALGARLTGAGFGGAVVALCEAALLPSVADRATRAYQQRTGLEPVAFTCRAVAGAGELSPSPADKPC